MSHAPYGVGDASYQAAGGIDGLRRLVDDFYQQMDSLPEAAALRRLHPEDLAPSRDKLACFLSGWLGGPRLFSEKYGAIAIPAFHAGPSTRHSARRGCCAWSGRSPGRATRRISPSTCWCSCGCRPSGWCRPPGRGTACRAEAQRRRRRSSRKLQAWSMSSPQASSHGCSPHHCMKRSSSPSCCASSAPRRVRVSSR